MVCPSDKRFLLLFTFLKKNRKKKIMVFFSSCNSVKFHSELLNYIDIPVMDIHGRQKQQKRTTSFFQFCKQVSLGSIFMVQVRVEIALVEAHMRRGLIPVPVAVACPLLVLHSFYSVAALC